MLPSTWPVIIRLGGKEKTYGTTAAPFYQQNAPGSSGAYYYGAAFKRTDGNCGYYDGQQCRLRGDFRSLPCGLHQRSDHSGVFRTGSRWNHHLYPVSWSEKSRDGKQICQTGSFYHNCHFCLHCHIGTDFPCTTAELYFRKSRCGCYG